MTSAQLATLIRTEKTKTNSTTFSDARIIALYNIFKDEIAGKIVERNAAFFQLSYTFNLVADTRLYAFPASYLDRLQKLELKFTSSASYFPSTYIKDYRGSETESEIVKAYGNEEGQFAHTIRSRGIFILSGTVPTLSNGARILYHLFPVDIAALDSTELSTDPSASTFGFPRQFHELVARRIVIEWKSGQPKPLPLSKHELNYENDLEAELNKISHQDNSGEILGSALPASDTGDNGHNY